MKAPGKVVEIADASCSMSFDGSSGALLSIVNVSLGDNLLKGKRVVAPPFRIHADFLGEWLLDTDPESAAKAHLGPEEMALRSSITRARGRAAAFQWLGDGLECALDVTLGSQSGESTWALKVRNAGAAPRSVVVEFPRLDGVHPGPARSEPLATFLNQAGYIEEAAGHPGGVYGNGGVWSMQWHAAFDPVSRSAIGLIVKDPEIRTKMLLPWKRSFAVRYFPPRVLAPGESVDLPPIVFLVHEGDWKRTARAYGAWYAKAFAHARLPEWFRQTDNYEGRHFKKKVPGAAPDHGGQFALESFRDLPAAHLRLPLDHIEYCFWSRGSMLHGVHTDGDNIIREDLGGPEAMREGVAAIHRLGLHATLYIEGYIVPCKSELARTGKAQRWSVMHRDGSITGGYTWENFYQMCPGCVEWQDHLVSVVSRVLRQTGVDGIRLDSLGFYFLPCYNSEHHHDTPFGYNQWMSELLSKVSQAALAVNPRALLTTEAPVDFYGQWFHGALTQEYPRGIPPMRLAVKPYRYFAYSQGGAPWGSISGSPGGRSGWDTDLNDLDANWLSLQPTILDALANGDVADEDPPATDPQVVTRRYIGKLCEVIVAVRPAGEGLRLPAYGKLSDHRASYEVRVPVEARSAAPMALCDLETFRWSRLDAAPEEGTVRVKTKSNWLAVIVPRKGVRIAGFDPLTEAHPGDELTIVPRLIAGRGKPDPVEVWAPGLKVGSGGSSRASVPIGGKAVIRVPLGAVPGLYQVRVRGRNVLGVKRLLRVRSPEP